MAKRKAMAKTEPTILNITRSEFEEKIQERIDLGQPIFEKIVNTQQEFDKNQREFYDWNDFNSELLKQSFNNEFNEYKKSYDDAGSYIGFSRLAQRGGTSPAQKLKDFKERIESKITNLNKLKAKTKLLKSSENEAPAEVMELEKITNNNIFIVHGHDEKTKTEIARTLDKLGLNPIILHEQANSGQTVIEKFENNSDVGFAIILLTCDDLGKTKTDEEENYRARQNVILEMGYFIGKLGRNRVFPLYESGVELPSDLSGIVYNPLDDSGKWKFDLVKELKAVNYNIDANKIL